VLFETVRVVETPNPAKQRGGRRVSCRLQAQQKEGVSVLESPLDASLTSSTSSWVAREGSQAEMCANMGDPTVRAGFDVGAAIEWASTGLSLECLEERVALLHPKRRRNLFLQPRCDIVVLQEEGWFDFVLTEPRFYQDAEYEIPAKGIAHEALLQRHRGDRLALPPPLFWCCLGAFVFRDGVIVIFIHFGEGAMGGATGKVGAGAE